MHQSPTSRIIQRQAGCPLETAALLFFDIETTSLRPDRGARLTEVALLDGERVVVDWKRDSDAEEDALASRLPTLFDRFAGGVVVGHNVGFDLHFVAYTAGRHGYEGPDIRYLDTLQLARRLLDRKSDFRLSELLSYFDIVPDGELHTALVDARATRALFWKLVEHGELTTLADAGLKQLHWSTL